MLNLTVRTIRMQNSCSMTWTCFVSRSLAVWLMEFHPDKCEVISVTRNQNPITYRTYYIHGHPLKHVDYVKYFGVHITSDLRWDKHIDSICSRANSSFGFIRRNVNIGNPRVKGLAYQSCVHPVLEYSLTSCWPCR